MSRLLYPNSGIARKLIGYNTQIWQAALHTRAGTYLFFFLYQQSFTNYMTYYFMLPLAIAYQH